MLGSGELPAILSGLAALFLLACAVTMAAQADRPERRVLRRLLVAGGFSAAALFLVWLVARILAEAQAAHALWQGLSASAIAYYDPSP